MKRIITHPAKYSVPILQQLGLILDAEQRRVGGPIKVLDPMCGVGFVHKLATPLISTQGVEIEWEWAQHPRTRCDDARRLPHWWTNRFDAICVSPDYGNRMADAFEPKDDSRRIGYRFALGRPLSEGSVVMHWGERYCTEHRKILKQMYRVTKPGGLIVVNVSNFIRAGELVNVVGWYMDELKALGLHLEQDLTVETSRMRMGQNHAARADYEAIVTYRKED